MRTIVDLPEDDVKTLDMMGKRDDLSRAELVRRAVSQYLEAEKEKSAGVLDQYFGLFKDDPDVFDGLDGLAWQEKMRSEWDDRDADIAQRLHENTYGVHDHDQLPIAGTPTRIPSPSSDHKDNK